MRRVAAVTRAAATMLHRGRATARLAAVPAADRTIAGAAAAVMAEAATPAADTAVDLAEIENESLHSAIPALRSRGAYGRSYVQPNGFSATVFANERRVVRG